jgi:hypothetical protein
MTSLNRLVLLFVLAVAVCADGRTIAVSNIVPLTAGLRTTMMASVLDSLGNVDTNYYGRIRVSTSSPDTVIEPPEFLVIAGRGEKTFYVRTRIPDSSLNLTWSADGDATERSTNLAVIQPEERFSRQTLVVNELMPDTDSDPLYEWIEWYNNSPSAINLTNLCVYVHDQRSTSTSYFFRITPAATVLPLGPLSVPSGGFLLMVRSYAAFRTAWPDVYDAILAGDDGYENTLIVSNGFRDTSKFQLSASGGTVYIASNSGLTAGLVGLFSYGDWGVNPNASIERVSPDLPAQDRNNWIIRTEGGTPGRKNTASDPGVPVANTDRKPLCADAQAVDGKVRIVFTAPKAVSSARISVISSSGRVARVLGDGLSFAKGQVFETAYDVKTEAGVPLSRGLYVVALTGQDASGRTVRYGAVFVAGTDP